MQLLLFNRILQSLFTFEDQAAIGSESDNLTITRNNFAIIITESLTHKEYERQIFSVEFGSPEEAVCNSTPISEGQLAVSSQSSARATGSIAIPNILEGRDSTQRVSYSVFRTDALFLTPKVTSDDYTIGSIIIGVRSNGTLDNKDNLTINLKPVSEVR